MKTQDPGETVGRILGAESGQTARSVLEDDWKPPKDFDETVLVPLNRKQKRRLQKMLSLGALRAAMGDKQMDAVREGTLAELRRRGYDPGDL